MKPAKQEALTEEDVQALNAAVTASEKRVAERQGTVPVEEKDPRGPRIACAYLQFNKAVNIPGGLYESHLNRKDNPGQRQWLIDYLPRLQMFELTFIPAPGERGETIVELFPREWAAFRPL